MTGKKSTIPILIRGQEADDWEGVAAILACDNVVYHTAQLPYLSRDVVRERLENPPGDARILVAVVNDRVVGNLHLSIGTGRRSHMAGLGITVHSDFQGRGVGTALMQAAIDLAEGWLNINRIELKVSVDNDVAVRLYKKFGFEIEGTLRDAVFRDGQYSDVYLMARLRDDVKAAPQGEADHD